MNVLPVIADAMDHLGLNYEYGRFTQIPPQYPYWVGDYTEPESYTEDGKRTATFILTGFSRGKLYEMERQKTQIAEYFAHGVTKITQSSTAVFVYYGGSMNLPVDDAELRKTQVNLSIKFWKGK